MHFPFRLAVHVLSICLSHFVLVRKLHDGSNCTDKYVTSTILDRLRLVNDTPHASDAF